MNIQISESIAQILLVAAEEGAPVAELIDAAARVLFDQKDLMEVCDCLHIDAYGRAIVWAIVNDSNRR